MKSFVRRVVLSLVPVCVAAAPALAQSSRYVRVGLGSASLEAPGSEFPVPQLVNRPALALGYLSARGHGVELRVSQLWLETAQVVPRHVMNVYGDAPYTTAVRATPIELAYVYQLPAFGPGGGVRPRIGAGAVAAHVVDRWRSDTPAEESRAWELGASATAGVAVKLAGTTSLVATGGYQRFDESSRPPRHVGLSGLRLGVGFELGF